MQLNDRTGETTVATNGMKMTIIAYKNSRDINIQFEDGTIAKHTSYYRFKKRKIRNPNKHTTLHMHETNIANNGMKMTIIKYQNSRNIDVQFKDGTIIKHKQYEAFKRGEITNPNIENPKAHKQHVQETNIANNGMKMTIITYKNSNDIDVQFEDGTIVKHRAYKNFKQCETKHPNIHIHSQSTTPTVTAPIHIGIMIATDYAYKYKGIANFICHCPICNKDYIMTIQEMKDHVCNTQKGNL